MIVCNINKQTDKGRRLCQFMCHKGAFIGFVSYVFALTVKYGLSEYLQDCVAENGFHTRQEWKGIVQNKLVGHENSHHQLAFNAPIMGIERL